MTRGNLRSEIFLVKFMVNCTKNHAITSTNLIKTATLVYLDILVESSASGCFLAMVLLIKVVLIKKHVFGNVVILPKSLFSKNILSSGLF